MCELLAELLSTARLDRRDRIVHFLGSSIAAGEAALASSGTAVASSLLSALLTPGGAVRESLGGLTQLDACRELLRRVDTSRAQFDELVYALERLRAFLIRAGLSVLPLADAPDGGVTGCLAAVTADATSLPVAEQALDALLSALPQGNCALPFVVAPEEVLSATACDAARKIAGLAPFGGPPDIGDTRRALGLVVPAQVAFLSLARRRCTRLQPVVLLTSPCTCCAQDFCGTACGCKVAHMAPRAPSANIRVCSV